MESLATLLELRKVPLECLGLSSEKAVKENVELSDLEVGESKEAHQPPMAAY